MENDNLLIFIAIIIFIIFMVLIICIIIILVCRKKRANDKCPNPSGNPDKSDLNSSPNDALLQPDPDRVFYENLPFHGIQNPPNKDLEDRPPSELSDYAVSSGYGSTRSHRPPDGAETSATSEGNSSQPRLKAVRKCSTIRHASNRTRPQFRSLRRLASLTKKNKTKEKNNNNIKEAAKEPPNIPAPDVPHHSLNTSTTNPSQCPKIRPMTFTKPPVPKSPPPEPPRIPSTQPSPPERPVPAPRKCSPSAPPRPPPPRHTYQNVPVPIEPNAAQQLQTPGLPLVTPKNFGLVYQPLKSSTGRSKSGRDGYHGGYPELPSPPPPPSYNGSLRSSRAAPPVYQSNHRHNKDYAIKFHDIGREIDV